MNSYTSPRTGLTVQRHPQGQALAEAFPLDIRNFPAELRLPDAMTWMHQHQGREAPGAFPVLNGEGLKDKLNQTWGPADGVHRGHHHLPELFYFLFEGRAVVGFATGSMLGSQWLCGDGSIKGGRSFPHYDPKLSEFWPGFLTTLAESMGYELSREQVHTLFGQGGDVVRRLETFELRQALDEGTQAQAPVRPGPRL